MKLGLKNDEVRLVSYIEKWAEEFERVKKQIEHETNLAASRIEHIGSTAIKNMDAKPIIDIVVGVDHIADVDPSLIKGLSKVGFLRLRVERPKEIVFAKFTDDTYNEKTHFIHLVDYKKELWCNLLFFRDYLNAHKNVREKYLALKQAYIKTSSTGITDYTDHKEAFVKEIYKKRTRP